MSLEEVCNYLTFFINGEKVIEHNAEPEWTLLWYLRNKRGLTGSKLGCGEGGCGACTVMVSDYDHRLSKVIHRAINACLAPICSMDGFHIITVEGIGNTKQGIHPIQERIAEFYGSQCGFCTPGIVMSLYGTLNNIEAPTEKDIEDSFDGNLCRCTGYRPILDAAKTFACNTTKKSECEGQQERCSNDILISTTDDKLKPYQNEQNKKCPTLEFPPLLFHFKPQYLHIRGMIRKRESVEWYRPVTLTELLKLKHLYPTSKLILGNSEIQIETKFKNFHYPIMVGITHIDELNAINRDDDGMILGAAVTLTRLKEHLEQWMQQVEPYQRAICHAILNQLKYFASQQIRNVACLGGNIVNASPISDLNPVLQACGAQLKLQKHGRDETRFVSVCDFFLSYRKVDIQPEEVLVSIHIPFTSKDEYIHSYKQARRRDDDIGIVSAGFRVKVSKVNVQVNGYEPEMRWSVEEAHLSLGGMAPITVMARKTEQFLKGQIWSKETMKKAIKYLLEELPLTELTPGGQPEYRRTLVTSFWFKFYLYVCKQLRKYYPEQSEATVEQVPSSHYSATKHYQRKISHGQQEHQLKPHTNKVVGSSVLHRSAYLQVTGEAKYTDDMPMLPGCLYSALVLSTQAHAKIIEIDKTQAEHVPGFVGYFGHQDVPGNNETGDIVHDEEVFVSSIVECVGQIIGICVADTESHAQQAAKLIAIKYENLFPQIFTIDQAIEHNKYLGSERYLEMGNLEQGMQESDHIIESQFYMGGQEHFYLETNCCLAVPLEEEEMQLWSSTQNPSKTQDLTAQALGIPSNKVVCHVKRMGGGFGGKETRTIPPCIAVAVAAFKLQRPIRLNIERDYDMAITGQRHAFKGAYKVGFTSKGMLKAMELHLYANAGWSHDLSFPVLERALFHCDNTYNFKNMKVYGRLCKTNLPSMTAFRGFGGPQGLMTCEIVIDHIAKYLKLEPSLIRRQNMYREGDMTHFKQNLTSWHIPEMWDELIVSSEYEQRLEQVRQFNVEHRYRKRGISIIPTKFGIAFTAKFLNQAGALIHIYKDGSILLTHGGTEMGQGLHTKMIQICSELLGVDISLVRISETSTDKVPNTSPTAASAASDLNGMAIKIACQQLNERLEPIRRESPDFTWFQLISKAYYERINLSAQGFYATPNVGGDILNNRAHFNYFTQGCGCSEVEIDTLTGDSHVIRTDILMDLGNSINPYIDIGQIEGAFVQGLGLMTMEELIWGDEQHKWLKPGYLFTRGPGTYKIPSFNDVPIDFRVSLFKNAPNPLAIFSSKAVGEPPLFLSSSVFFAIKQACESYRQENGIQEFLKLNSPATSERIRMACSDEFTKETVGEKHAEFQAQGSF
ncbi:unnamed protein product [Didymodactylos carnosus]|uniref:xanthine dehydrogenase n=1 Tax=Didymodactylos carnosus TaxID=1234261 RepID=A0A814GNB6_9BILA|nr:unnamed protein product [Didymodactylos carnosus]CAF0998983.1 unnamed protein product [Didymodactylos carnosus]CAF3616775.1 unnamed protein product [Didymodactylos carnosus]CAF3770467.1 unnamed protein product [Didymodactylos carnosus]